MKRHMLSLLLPTLALSAQSPVTFEVQAGLIAPMSDLKKMQGDEKGLGYTLGGAVRIAHSENFAYRFHANLAGIGLAKGTGMDAKGPKHLMAGMDLLHEAGKWTFFEGLVGIKFKQDSATASDERFADWALVAGKNTNKNNSPKGVKLGFRVGLEYAVTNQIRAQVSFTQAEFNKIYNPSWFTIGATYRF